MRIPNHLVLATSKKIPQMESQAAGDFAYTYNVVEMKNVMLNSGMITNFWLAQQLQSTHSVLTL